MHILIAPNAFKNSISATQAAQAIQEGLAESRLHHSSECFPIADGGDGTATLIAAHCDGQKIFTTSQDPLGRSIDAIFFIIDEGRTAVIEMAEASGLRRLQQQERNPLIASSDGTGKLIKEAIDRNVSHIILTMGGSATVDGGTGILRALGLRFLDDEGNELAGLPEQLPLLNRIDKTGLHPSITNTSITVLCDVDNRLLGEQGAAAVFGPQKGAGPKEIELLNEGLKRLADISREATGTDMASLQYGGTAGGAAAGLHCWIGAQLVSGTDYFLTLTHFDEALQKADLLITAEGAIDEQTLEGKAPAGVAIRAKQKAIPVIGLAGKIPEQISEKMQPYFDQILPISKEKISLEQALKNTYSDLKATAKALGDHLSR